MEDRIYQNIIAWLDGTLTGDERREFEAEIRSNPELAQEVALTREALQAINEPAVDAMRNQLRTIMQEDLPSIQAKSKTVRMFPFRRTILLAASLALLAVLCWWLFGRQVLAPPQAHQVEDKQDLLAAYFPAPKHLISEAVFANRRDALPHQASAITAILEQTNQLYTNRQYAAALDRLSTLPSTDPVPQYYDQVSFFTWQGILLLQLNRPSEALQSFDHAEKIRQTETAGWYKIGALLALDRKDEAKKQLQNILGKPHHPKVTETTALLNQLK